MISIKLPRSVFAALASLPLAAATALVFLRVSAPAAGAETWAAAVLWAILNSAFFLMACTGRTDRWRLPLFLLYSALFGASFLLTGTAAADLPGAGADFMCREGLPLCHIAAIQTVIPAALKKVLIWPGVISGVPISAASILLTWLGASLVLGRGWCSWGCFFGGLDDLFSRLLPRAVITRFPSWLKSLPPALLLFTLLVSAAVLFPVYCIATCPFKLVTEIPSWGSVGEIVRVSIYTSVFVVMVVVLPLLMKRRAQCSFLCPLGALQTGTSFASPFEIKVDRETCEKCGECVKACPSLVMTERSLALGGPGAACTRCGRCADVCPRKAVYYHVKGTPDGSGRELARLMFLYPAFLIMSYFMSGPGVGAVAALLRAAGAAL